MIELQKLDKYEKALYYEIFVKKEYSKLDNKIKTSSIIFDVGSHIGLFALYCKSLNINIEVHLFEPLRVTYDKSLSILSNHSNLHFSNLGIWSEKKEMDIIVNIDKTMQSSLYKSFMNDSDVVVTSKFIYLGDYIKENYIDKIDILKLDIEGAEYEVISSIKKDIFDKIDSVFIEYHLLNIDHESKFDSMKEYLFSFYPNIEQFSNPYSDRLGYLYCYKV